MVKKRYKGAEASRPTSGVTGSQLRPSALVDILCLLCFFVAGNPHRFPLSAFSSSSASRHLPLALYPFRVRFAHSTINSKTSQLVSSAREIRE